MTGEVVIVGAGPAGASLSYLLARRGIGVTLLERHTDFAREFRGETLMPSGVEAFAEMGLTAELDALPQGRIAALEFYQGARRLFRVGVEEIGIAPPRVVSQPAMLEMLVARASGHESFRLLRGMAARDLVRDGERVGGVRAASREGEQEVRGNMVIGADGRSSVLRTRAGLHERRAPESFDVVWCKVPSPDFLEPETARAYLGAGQSALAFPSYGGHLQIGWVIEKGTFGDLRRRGVTEWLEELATHLSPDLAAHLHAHSHEVTQPYLLNVVCDRLTRWTCPGLLLLGDAAHPMSPVGAQGINVALRDAIVAANYLVPALADGASPSRLDAAAREVQHDRLSEVQKLQRLQKAPPRVLFGQNRLNTVVVEWLLPLLIRSGIAARLFGATFRRFAYGFTEVRLRA